MNNVTLDEVITYFDEQCPNQYSREEKIRWISELDERIYEDIIKPRQPLLYVTTFNGYGDDAYGDTVLLVPSMFKDIYKYWIEKNVDINNREIGAANNAIANFTAIYEDYYAWYNRNHIITQNKRIIF